MIENEKSLLIPVISIISMIISGLGIIVFFIFFILINYFANTIFDSGFFSKKVFSGFNIFSNMALFIQVIFIIILLVHLFIFISAIALYMRKNWARISFIGILAFGIIWEVWRVFTSLISTSFLSHFSMVTKFFPGFDDSGMVLLSHLFPISISVLFAWIISRLLSDEIRYEFSDMDNN